MMDMGLERMRAIIKQALAEAKRADAALAGVHLAVYGVPDDAQVQAWFAEVTANTAAEDIALTIHRPGTRYICWNCCGLRFEGDDGVCPNCGETALEVPDEVAFGLRRVITADDEA